MVNEGKWVRNAIAECGKFRFHGAVPRSPVAIADLPATPEGAGIRHIMTLPLPANAPDASNTGLSGFKLLGLDDTLYGPVDLPQLIEWAQDERIQPDSWLYCLANRKWISAAESPELRVHLASWNQAVAALPPELQPDQMRRIRAFMELSVEQLVRLAAFTDVQHYPAGTMLMRAGTPGDAVMFLLSGRVRLKLMVKGRELTISQVEPGGVFGQITLFDNGPRVTDAVAEADITCARMTIINFRRLCRSAPDLAVPIILGLGKTLASRIRSDDKHLCELAAMQAAMG